MTFERQSTGGKFVAFGKAKAKENSFVVEAKKYLEGYVQEIKGNDKFGVILEINSKACPETLVVTGTTVLNRELGYEWDKDKPDDKGDFEKLLPLEECQSDYRVAKGDLIRINFEGMIKTKKGKDAYKLFVEVDRKK